MGFPLHAFPQGSSLRPQAWAGNLHPISTHSPPELQAIT
jgi:hypothetical protein